MSVYSGIVPGGGWHAELEVSDGGDGKKYRNVPVVGWALYDYGAVPLFVPGVNGAFSAYPLTKPSVSANPEWGIRRFSVYHPDSVTTSRACSQDGMLKDPA